MEYYSSGQRQESKNYKNGKLQGEHIKWDEIGTKVVWETYEDGILNGPASYNYRWSVRPMNSEKGFFLNGERNGEWIEEYNNRYSKGKYENNRKVGEWIVYNKLGKIIDREIYD